MSAGRKRKVLTGIVVSNKMDKTIVVKVETFKKQRTYKKYFKRSKKYKVHAERNQAKLGDKVQIMETRPLSKEKRWVLLKVLK